ncbi:TIGR04013 family B12-binding domain/radical SAM domain-containing protein [Candidatus Sumerlaeota bacterium]|nr:TIGR04013 family B12-binding domain/radical SAM domain-containing protein [Candidatus Sumerlaeota bacterium]
MSVTLVFAHDKSHRGSIVALLGSLEREGLAGECEIRLIAWDQLIEAYEQTASLGQPCIAAFSLATCDVPRFVTLVERLRAALRPGDLVIAGGPHPTAADREILARGADVVFRGEADVSFPLFVQAIVAGQEWRNVPGLSFMDGTQLVRTALPEPIEMSRVRSHFEQMRLLAPLELTRGCLHACRFCQTPSLWQGPVRHRTIASVLSEMAFYEPTRFVRLLSPNAFGYRAERSGEPNVTAIVAMLEAARARYPDLRIIFGAFPSEVRPDYVRRDLVRAIRPLIGNRYLAVGAQSGSDRVLDLCRRGHTVADVLRAVEIIRGEGMGALVDIIFGLPGEQPDDVRATCRMMETIESWGGRFRIHIFSPLPGTEFADAEAARPLDPHTLVFLDDLARRGRLQGGSDTCFRSIS